uniref:Transposase n=1 Tax=Panagrellus redivivus TaxID=6233 RepID=A0A7E4W8P2_PANRE
MPEHCRFGVRVVPNLLNHRGRRPDLIPAVAVIEMTQTVFCCTSPAVVNQQGADRLAWWLSRRRLANTEGSAHHPEAMLRGKHRNDQSRGRSLTSRTPPRSVLGFDAPTVMDKKSVNNRARQTTA